MVNVICSWCGDPYEVTMWGPPHECKGDPVTADEVLAWIDKRHGGGICECELCVAHMIIMNATRAIMGERRLQ
jgi:hypothetical protein